MNYINGNWSSNFNTPLFRPTGWQCPCCGRVWSPSTFCCWNCNHAPIAPIPMTSQPAMTDEQAESIWQRIRQEMQNVEANNGG